MVSVKTHLQILRTTTTTASSTPKLTLSTCRKTNKRPLTRQYYLQLVPSPPPPSPPLPPLSNTVRPRESLYTLPAHPPLSVTNFMWGNLDGVTYTKVICSRYSELVHWHTNLLKVPSEERENRLFLNSLAFFEHTQMR